MAVFTAIGASIFGAGTFLAAVTAAGLQVAAGVAISLIAKSMQGEPQPSRFGVQGQVQTGDDVPRSILFGWNCTAGSKVYQNEWGPGGIFSTRVIALADYPVRELRRVMADGTYITLGATAHPQYGYPALEYRKGGVDHLWVKFYDGTQTTADSFLTGTVSSTERPYGVTRVGTGIAYAIVTSRAPERRDDEEKPLFQGFPQFKFETYGARLYDPSRDGTVGGVGSQRADDPATWGGDGDFLAPVQIYNLLRGIRLNGKWLYGMQALATTRLPAANWIAAINRARAQVAGPDGNEPTFRAGGEIQAAAPVHLAIEAMLTACNGRLVEVGGAYKLYVGEPGSPVMAFEDSDILSSEEQSFSPFHALADTVNGVSATYPNPAEGWAEKKAPPLLRPDLEALHGDRRLLASVALDMVPYSAQAQRLMQWALAEALRARRHTLVLGPEYWVLEPGDIVSWTSARNGYEAKLFRVDGVVYKGNLDVIVDLTEVDPADYDWDQESDYRPVTDGQLQLVGPVPMPMQGWQVFPAEIKDEDGVSRRPSIEVRAASGVPNVERVRVQVRVGSETGGLIFDSDAQPYGDPWRWVLQGQFPNNVACKVRGIFILRGGGQAEWSAWLDVKTPNVKLTERDISVDLAQLAGEQLGQLAAIRSLIEQFKQVGTLIEEIDRENAFERDAMFREIMVQLNDNVASFTQIIEVAVTPLLGALATRVDSLYAAHGGNTSQINSQWSVEATEEGYGATYGLQLAVDADGVFRAATMFADVPEDPDAPTRWGFMAGQFVWFTSAGVPIVAMNEDGRQVSANGVKVIDWVTGAESTTVED